MWSLTGDNSPVDVLPLDNELSAVYRIAISPDGRWLVAGGTEQEIHLWPMNQMGELGEPIYLIHDGGGITNLEFSDDSCTLFSGGSGLSIHYWSLCPLGQSTEAHELRGNGSTTYLDYLSGLNALVSIDNQGMLSMWDLNIQTLMLEAEKVVSRDFTEEEWARFFYEVQFTPTLGHLDVVTTRDLD